MKKKKREPFIDDGRVIANMNVEGMPWYKGIPDTSGASDSKKQVPIELTAQEKRAMMRGVMSAALLVTFIFVTVFALFIVFCIFVWFK